MSELTSTDSVRPAPAVVAPVAASRLAARVLIVDDDPGLRKSLALVLANEGYEVAAEGDAVRALERLESEAFDVVLCDVRMPGLDGIEFVRRHHSAGGRAMVIAMSGYGGDEQALATIKEGAHDYISKPFRADEVLLTLRKAEARERLRARGTGAGLKPAPGRQPQGSAGNGIDRPLSLRDAVRAAEGAAVRRALAATAGNRSRAAHMLGISLRTLYYKLRDLAE
jgi:DNA-binding NtrC family response regulator